VHKALAVLVVAVGSTAFLTASARAGTDVSPTGTDSGTLLWVSRYHDPAAKSHDSFYLANSVAVSPDGREVFVTGSAPGARAPVYATVAYDAVSGAQLWVRRYDGPGNGINAAHAVAVSPSGKTVFVTGASNGGTPTGSDYATIAYAAVTGKRLWVSRYNGPASGNDDAYAIAVSPRGGTVFVTGHSAGKGTKEDYATVAYNGRTGAERWVSRYNGPGNGNDSASAISVSPGGGTVFVTGTSASSPVQDDYATVAYNAKTGGQLWVSRYSGLSSSTTNQATSLAVSDSGTVFVTGQSYGSPSAPWAYATVAYDGATGAQLWAQRFGKPGPNSATSIAVAPNGSAVYVTGQASTARPGYDYATVAYSGATGAEQWVRRYGPDGDAVSVAVSRTGTTVYVTGTASKYDFYATVAYRASTGSTLWLRRYQPREGLQAAAMAVSPASGAIYVTGTSFAQYVTVAYSG
jgi:hypothetical protein